MALFRLPPICVGSCLIAALIGIGALLFEGSEAEPAPAPVAADFRQVADCAEIDDSCPRETPVADVTYGPVLGVIGVSKRDADSLVVCVEDDGRSSDPRGATRSVVEASQLERSRPALCILFCVWVV